MHLKEMVVRRREVWTEKIDNGNGKRSDAERPDKIRISGSGDRLRR